MITVVCPCCGSEREASENVLVDLRCITPRCVCTTVVFKQNVERRPHLQEGWEKIKVGEEVPVGEKQTNLNSYLWTIKRAVKHFGTPLPLPQPEVVSEEPAKKRGRPAGKK